MLFCLLNHLTQTYESLKHMAKSDFKKWLPQQGDSQGAILAKTRYFSVTSILKTFEKTILMQAQSSR